MLKLDFSTVLDSEIDSLGHMNVRFYLSRVDRANKKLLRMNGVVTEEQHQISRFDTYSRFRREQFSGAELVVLGGVLEVVEGGVRCYFEIRNTVEDQLAASFITVSQIVALDTQSSLIPRFVDGGLDDLVVPLPKYASPRSLSLAAPNTQVTLAALEQRITPEAAAGMMSGRREALVLPEDCDATGVLRDDVDLMFVLHRPQPGEAAKTMGPPVLRTDSGNRFSWAMIETRAMTLARPQVDDQLISLGADVAYGSRWRQARRWMYVAQTGTLLGIYDTVGLALDLDERRAIDVPESMQRTIERSLLPDLL